MYQKVLIIGRLGRDPEMRFAPSGTPVTNFSVATDRKYKKDDQTVTETVWFNVEAWGRSAEVVNEYLKKGNQVFVEGRLKTPRVWQGQDGQYRANLEVVVETVKFLTGKTNGSGESEEVVAEGAPAEATEEITF